ncbi:hypothetical protein GCM10028862_18360 [Luteimonas pelagia]
MALYDPASIKGRKKLVDFENNTNISLRHRYVYFAVDKVANSSIKNSLFEIEYAPVGKKTVTLYDKRSSPLLSPYQLPIELLRDVLNSGNYFRFAFVRNPYSRLLSCYLDRILTASSKPRRQLNAFIKRKGGQIDDVSFEAFIEAICEQSSNAQNSHWRVQADDILHGEVEFDFIGKFERLWQDMAIVSSRIWGELRPEMANKDVNKSPRATNAGGKLREFYTPELAARVAERFAADFDAFGYERDISTY